MNCKEVGDFIAKLRKQKRITQSELGEKVGVTDKAVSKWERGICMPDHSLLKPLAKTLDISITELLEGKKLENIDDKEMLNAIHMGALRYSNENKKRVIKISVTIIVPLIFLVMLLLVLFILSNYGNCSIFNIESRDDNISVNGHIAITNEKKIIVLSNFLIIDEELFKNDKGYDFEYSLYIGNNLVYKKGNVAVYENKETDQLSNVIDYIQNINLYLSDDLGQHTYIDNEYVTNSNMNIKISYINDKLECESYIVEFKLLQVFSNDKFLYKTPIF